MSEDKNRYMETDPEDAKTQQARRGRIKLDNSKSQFTQKSQSRDEFEERATVAHSAIIEKNRKAADLSQEFWNMIRNKELSKNKGPISKSREKEVVTSLISYARELNNPIFDENDPNPPEDGLGSMSIIALLMKTVMHQRDLYNELDFKLTQAEKQIEILSRQNTVVTNAK